MLPSVLKPAEKRALDLIADWPWLTPPHLGALMALERTRLAEVLGRLASLELVRSVMVQQRRRLVLTDRALAMLARRGPGVRGRREIALERRTRRCAALALGRRRPQPPAAPERRAHRRRPLVRRGAGEAGACAFAGDPPTRPAAAAHPATSATAASCAPSTPTPSASCAREHLPRPSSSSGSAAPCGPRPWRPRLAPYLRYYSSQRPTDDHGVQPVVLVVFEDEIAQAHFLRVAKDEMARTGVSLPLFVSHRELLEREGPLGRAWRAVGDAGLGQAFPIT